MNRYSRKRLFALGTAIILATAGAFVVAQVGSGFDLTWKTFAGGGGTSTGGGFSVFGTIGQSAAGSSSGGGFTVEGGFVAGSLSAALTPVPTVTPTPIPSLPLDLDYTGGQGGSGDARGWLGGAFPGFGGASSLNSAGLCMTVPGPGDNFVLWVSPERLVELVDDRVYRVRLTVATDQQTADAIPLWFLTYDNFNTGGAGNNYGGFLWVLDVDGGANGVGRAQGRASFDFYFAPTAFQTPQWKTGAFTPQADFFNDMRLQYRIIDANASVLTNNDSGTICISHAVITSFDRAAISASATTPFNPPIGSTTHFAEAFSEIGIGGTGVIDNVNHRALYDIGTAGSVRKTLGPFDPTQANLNLQLYPVVWESNALYRVRTSIKATANETDPVDVIFLSADTTTNELGMVSYVTRGATGAPMDKAGSPKLTSAEFEGYFFGQNSTVSIQPNANRLRPLAFFFNTPDQGGGSGTGADQFAVETLIMDKLTAPQ